MQNGKIKQTSIQRLPMGVPFFKNNAPYYTPSLNCMHRMQPQHLYITCNIIVAYATKMEQISDPRAVF